MVRLSLAGFRWLVFVGLVGCRGGEVGGVGVVAAESGVGVAVEQVDDDADGKPDDEPEIGLPGQA